MSAEPKIFIPSAPADHGICEKCEFEKGTELYNDRLLCTKCYDLSTIGDDYEDYRAEFEQWLEDEEDDDYDDLFIG